MGKNLVLAAKNQNIKRLINLSSSCVYPKNMDKNFEEDTILSGPLEPTNEGYALAKFLYKKYVVILMQIILKCFTKQLSHVIYSENMTILI